MTNQSTKFEYTTSLTLGSPAIYQIEVLGRVDEKWSANLGGMNITSMKNGNRVITTLIGKLKDQAALAGLLQSLYEMKIPILSVQYKE